MATEKLTIRAVNALNSQGKDEYLWDTDLKGFGIKATLTGAKVYIVQYRMGGRAAKTKRYTIGKHGSPWTPEKARDEAKEILTLADKGIDPHRRKVDQQRKVQETDFEQVVSEFIEKYAKPRNRSWQATERIFNQHIISAFKGRSLLSITRADVNDLLDSVAEHGEALANKVFANLRKLLNWSIERGILDVSPMRGMRTPYSEVQRERVLSEEEIRLVWNTSEQLGWPFAPWVKLLLLTGQRRSEVAAMRWQDIDLKQKIWTIPGTVAKNGNAHAVPLSGMAVELLESVPKITPKGLVFTTTRVTPISGFSRAKKRLDNEILAAMREQAVKRKEEPEKVKALPEWRLHDLRRTAATGMASLRIPPHIVEAVLNHKSGTVSGVAAVYNRFDYADEKRAALEAWASKMQSLLSGGDGDKVLVMRERVAK